jgi:hypothetical protein
MPYDNWLQALLPHFKEAFSRALQQLLQDKNLCQSVSIDLNFIKTWAFARTEGTSQDSFQAAGDRFSPKDTSINAGAHILNASWYPEGCAFETSELSYALPGSRLKREQGFSFPLPHVKMSCTECQERSVFKADLPRCRFVAGREPSDEQSLLLSYECQGCRSRRVTFFVSRKGNRMLLSGRDTIETLPVPRSVPSVVAEYCSEAQIAHHNGRNLAAFILLREFIEQFWRSLPEMQEPLSTSARMTAEEVGECYTAQLPLEFKSQYPSLTDCHRWLNDAIHGPPMRRDLFEFCLRDIVEHLDGRRFRRLSTYSAAPFDAVGAA